MNEVATLSLGRNEYAVKVGASVKMLAAESVMVLGGKTAATILADFGYQLALKKAENGNYRAAVEIVCFGATPAQIKARAPADGGTWTKARVLVLATLVIERKAPEKGWSAKAQKGRFMAAALLKLLDPPKANPVAPEVPAQPVDTLAGVAPEEAPM